MISPPSQSQAPKTTRWRCAGALLCAALAAGAGCSDNSQQTPPPAYPQQYPAPQPYPNQPVQSQPGVAPGAPPAAAPGVVQPAAPQTPAPIGTVVNDPISTYNLVFLRAKTQEVLNELIVALPAASQQRVAGIPLVVDDALGEVNAFAACSRTGQSAMAITDGLLQIQASLAQAQAHDEFFQTRKVDEFVALAAQQIAPGRAVPFPPAGFFPGASDSRIVTRQHQVFEEQVAFVLGHELGHHYLGHLPCTARPDPLGAGEAARILSSQISLFNQPNEIAADLAGTQNVLNAGRNRQGRGGYAWAEGGGLLTMRFFAGFGRLTPGAILTSFERSHPPPQLRTPIIQQAAATWHATGGAPLPILGF